MASLVSGGPSELCLGPHQLALDGARRVRLVRGHLGVAEPEAL